MVARATERDYSRLSTFRPHGLAKADGYSHFVPSTFWFFCGLSDEDVTGCQTAGNP
jgi:hypothetical protein